MSFLQLKTPDLAEMQYAKDRHGFTRINVFVFADDPLVLTILDLKK